MSFVEVNAYGQYCRFGVEWNESNAAATCTIQPTVYRFDYNSTQDNSAWTEQLRYEPNGSTGSWNLSGYGQQPSTAREWRVIDTFQSRTYDKTHSTQTVKIRIRREAGALGVVRARAIRFRVPSREGVARACGCRVGKRKRLAVPLGLT